MLMVFTCSEHLTLEQLFTQYALCRNMPCQNIYLEFHILWTVPRDILRNKDQQDALFFLNLFQ
jgi:hypothetical protein